MRRKKDGKIILIDFGAVKEIDVLEVNEQGKTILTSPIGSSGYMPSEQAKGKPLLPSDIYAVGMIGIQALTGLSPQKLQETTDDKGDLIWRNCAQVSDGFAEVLTKMVRDHFTNRFQNATEALEALNNLPLPSVATVLSPALSPTPRQNPDTKDVMPPTPRQNPEIQPISARSPSKLPIKAFIGLGVTATLIVAVIYAITHRQSRIINSVSSPTISPTRPYSRADLKQLRYYLHAQKWKEADEETYQVMLKVLGREKEGYFALESIKNFYCPALIDINELWFDASGGQFGFSVQQQIWKNLVDSKPGVVNQDIYNNFGDLVGWRNGGSESWKDFSSLTFKSNAPKGHLPVLWNKKNSIWADFKEYKLVGRFRLWERYKNCTS